MPVDPMPANHDLLGYYVAAVQAGMRQLPFDVEGILQGLAELHKDLYARYPKERRPVMTATYFDDPTDQICWLLPYGPVKVTIRGLPSAMIGGIMGHVPPTHLFLATWMNPAPTISRCDG